MDQAKPGQEQSKVQTDSDHPIWDNAEQLTPLRDRAGKSGDQLAKVLFEASLQSLDDKQQANAFRQRVTEALMTQADAVDTPKISVEQTTKDDQPTIGKHEHHLKAPSPVSLYEDPLKYKASNPLSITAMSEEKQDQVAQEMEQSRENAILLSEAHNELFRPLMGLAACFGLIVLIGYGAYVKGWIGQPKTATASPTIEQPLDQPVTP